MFAIRQNCMQLCPTVQGHSPWHQIEVYDSLLNPHFNFFYFQESHKLSLTFKVMVVHGQWFWPYPTLRQPPQHDVAEYLFFSRKLSCHFELFKIIAWPYSLSVALKAGIQGRCLICKLIWRSVEAYSSVLLDLWMRKKWVRGTITGAQKS